MRVNWRSQRCWARSGDARALDRGLDRKRRQRGPRRMVFIGERRAEDRHEAIAQELIHGALEAMHFGQRTRKEIREQGMHRFGAERTRERGRVHHIAEQYRDLFLLTAQGVSIGEDLLREMGWGVIGRAVREFRRVRAGAAQRRPAGPAETLLGGDRRLAGRALPCERLSTLRAELRVRRVLVMASLAVTHADPLPNHSTYCASRVVIMQAGIVAAKDAIQIRANP